MEPDSKDLHAIKESEIQAILGQNIALENVKFSRTIYLSSKGHQIYSFLF
jgi:hypothetical protein